MHYAFDYYPFSEQAVREVFFDDMESVRVRAVMTPPRMFGQGYKRRRQSAAETTDAHAARQAPCARGWPAGCAPRVG